MLSLFAQACWPSVYFLWRNVCLGPLPIFGLGCFSVIDVGYDATMGNRMQIYNMIKTAFNVHKNRRLEKICQSILDCLVFFFIIFSTKLYIWLPLLQKSSEAPVWSSVLLMEWWLFLDHQGLEERVSCSLHSYLNQHWVLLGSEKGIW